MLLDVFKTLTVNQFEAALCTLNLCVERCPESAWNGPVVNYKFCQAVFHTLFFTDYYLGPDEQSFRTQLFHREHAAFFRDYEEFEDRAPVLLYDKPSTRTYLEFCRRKAAETMGAETEQSLGGPSGFERRKTTRAELHVYNMRHIQHHAAQLSLRLRIDSQIDIPWVSSGWRDVVY